MGILLLLLFLLLILFALRKSFHPEPKKPLHQQSWVREMPSTDVA
jgi:hypothetical protein